MPIDVRMPKLSDNMAEGVIIRWMKGPGDQVEKGEPLAEVETDKADVELEASDSGVLREIRVAEGQSAAVGAVIAVLAPVGEAAGAEAPASEAGDGRQPRETRLAAPAAASQEQRAAEDPRPSSRPAAPASRPAPAPKAQAPVAAPSEQSVRASPLAWRVAEDAGVNLASVRGSGPGGRIVKRDVEAAMRGPEPRAAAKSAPVPEGRGEREVEDEISANSGASRRTEAAAPAAANESWIEPVSRMRATIARRMAEAKREIPHFYVTAEIDMTEAMHLRESIKRREAMPGLTVTHVLMRALAIALVRHPRVNASWREAGIELHADVNIGIAVAVEDGLVVPVLHRAQTLTLGEIVARAAALTEKARQGRFGGDDLSGGTFSLSNVGMLDVEELVAVINPPQAAILAVGAVKDRPIVRDGQLAVAKTLRATLSCDHRVLNGVEGGRFLVELKGILENPVTLLLE